MRLGAAGDLRLRLLSLPSRVNQSAKQDLYGRSYDPAVRCKQGVMSAAGVPGGWPSAAWGDEIVVVGG